jgi:hypothetical protein
LAAPFFAGVAARFFAATLVLRGAAARAVVFPGGAAASVDFSVPALVRRIEATSLSPVLSFVLML